MQLDIASLLSKLLLLISLCGVQCNANRVKATGTVRKQKEKVMIICTKEKEWGLSMRGLKMGLEKRQNYLWAMFAMQIFGNKLS